MSFENITILDNKLTLIEGVRIKVPILSISNSFDDQSFIVDLDDPELIHIFIFLNDLTGFSSKNSEFVYERILEKLLRSSKVSINNKTIFHQWNIYGLSYESYKRREPSTIERESYYAKSYERLNAKLNGNREIIWKEYLDQIYYLQSNSYLESFNVSVKNSVKQNQKSKK
tara:strand:+ start:2652 stop:3164 length:513 start_codon:yes stop_codon:yes gene_type:complete